MIVVEHDEETIRTADYVIDPARCWRPGRPCHLAHAGGVAKDPALGHCRLSDRGPRHPRPGKGAGRK